MIFSFYKASLMKQYNTNMGIETKRTEEKSKPKDKWHLGNNNDLQSVEKRITPQIIVTQNIMF